MELPRQTRSIVAQEIVEAVERLGISDDLHEQGITFTKTNNPANDMRVNAQKIYRWLGHYDGITNQDDKLFHVEQAIVAAMPEQIRLDYLNDLYAGCGVVITASQAPQATKATSLLHAIQIAIKESGEAHAQALQAINDTKAIKKAEQEIEEAIVALQTMIASLKSNTTEKLKVVG